MNSVYYWFKVLPQRHLIAFLTMLERLPEPRRRELINSYCRELPVIDHPRFAHDPLAVSALERLLFQRKGLTWIEGGTDYQRAFVLSALGHSFPRICGQKAVASGLDIFEPRKLVPVERVIYLNEAMPALEMRRLMVENWPVILASKAQLLLLNGVWSTAPELREEILRLSTMRHVVVTVAKSPDSALLNGCIVTLSVARENSDWLRIAIRNQTQESIHQIESGT